MQDATAEPRARVTYTAAWYDAAGRQIASADYGTNGGEAFIRPDAVPERSDTCLVTSTLYNARGEAFCTIDPMGRQDRVAFDDAGRTIETIENYQGGLSQFSRSENGTVPFPADANKTTRMTYTPDGQLATLTAINPTTGDQTTRYVYGSTLVESFVARSDLLRAEIYPDSDDSRYDDGEDQTYDRIEYSYNAQGERKSLRDQNGTVRGFLYDKLGRLLHDFVESLGPGVDGRVRRISRTYGLAGRLEKLTSYTHTYPKTGAIANEVLFRYSDTGLPVAEYQSHQGPVDMAATPQVQYGHDDTLDGGELVKGLRPTRVVYPNGRIVRYEYADSGASSSSSGTAAPDPDDLLNRIKLIADDDSGAVGTHLAEYTRLGLNTIVRVDYTEPQIRYDLAHGAGDDPYAGLDRFGRVIDLLWRNYGTAEDVVRIRHGYDRAGNRLYREDPVAAAHGVDLDEAYCYDGLYQLKTFVRGALNAQKTAIAAPTFRQAWDFDTTGNWQRFREDKDGDGRWDLDQARTHNAANELTAFESKIGDLWICPLHDRNGNMVRIPQPKDPTKQFTLRYDPWNRLVRVSDPAGPVADYSYDARNFRILKEVHRDPADPIPGEESFSRYPETRHFYYNSSWQCLEERRSPSPTVPPDSLPADRQFLWGLRYIDDLLLRDRATSDTPEGAYNERLYVLQDPNWNAAAIVDSVGYTVERYDYAAYGKCRVRGLSFTVRPNCTSRDWDYAFGGRPLDRMSYLQDNRNRVLHVVLGRWIARDARDMMDGTNQYAFVRNGPLGALDPSGDITITGVDRGAVGPCGLFAIPYRCQLDAPAPEDGYIVQEVTIYVLARTADEVAKLGEVPYSAKDWPKGAKMHHFFEYWAVSRGEKVPNSPVTNKPYAKGEPVDIVHFGLPFVGSQARIFSEGRARFYTRSVTGRLNWPEGFRRGLPSGDIPAQANQPAFWANQPTEVGERSVLVWADCCPDEKGQFKDVSYYHASPKHANLVRRRIDWLKQHLDQVFLRGRVFDESKYRTL